MELRFHVIYRLRHFNTQKISNVTKAELLFSKKNQKLPPYLIGVPFYN